MLARKIMRTGNFWLTMETDCYQFVRVGTRFREFPQTPRGRGFSLLGFYALFKCSTMLRFS